MRVVALADGSKNGRAAADPALRAPAVRVMPDARYGDDRRAFQGVPTIERTANGRLWAAWFARRGTDRGDDHVLLVSSDDGGRSWSRPQIVINPAGAVCAFDPCLWLDPDGVLWLFWAQSYGTWDGRGGVWCITSEDSRVTVPTWSEPRRLCDGVMLNKPCVLKSGDWLLPVSIWERKADPAAPSRFRRDLRSSSGAGVYAFRHASGGLEMLGRVRAPQREYDEHHIVERDDGSLWMLIRAPYGIAESVSADGGHSWSNAQRAPLRNVNSRFCIRRLSSGHLLLITHEPPDGKTRSHLIARISTDDGRTWKGGLMLDERPGVSYPDATEGPKGVIHVIYDCERTGAKEILLAQFNEGHVLRGKPSRTTRLRVVVNQATGGASRDEAN